jgi:hypothetical protein
MNQAIALTKALCCVVLTFALCWFLWDASDSLNQISEDSHTLAQNLTQTVIKLNTAADNDAKYYDQAAKELPKTSHSARALVDSTRKAVDQLWLTTLPVLNHTIAQIGQDSHQSFMRIDQATSSADIALKATAIDLDSLNKRIADPQIDLILGHLDVASLHLAQAADNGNRILGHGDHIISYYDARLTSPKGFVKTLASGLLQLVSPGAEVFLACCK